MSDIDIEGRLEGRGILAVAQELGWEKYLHFGAEGWRYPVRFSDGRPHMVDGKPAYRWKHGTPGGHPKYQWLPGKPETARYYTTPGALEAIRESQTVYLASGEPDVLAYRAAGIANVLCWFDGEASVPKTLAEDLGRMGASLAYYYPDRDKTGMEATAKIREALAFSGVELLPYTLPGDIGSKNDINWLWQDSGFDAGRFRERLALCEPVNETDLYLYSHTMDNVPLGATGAPILDASALYREWIEHIRQALGRPARREGHRDRWHCPLPTHQDDTPSFRVATEKNQDLPWPMCSCGIQNYSNAWELVADALGVDRWEEFKARKKQEGFELADDRTPPPTHKDAKVEIVVSDNALTISRLEALANIEAELSGKAPSVEPIVFPFNLLHQFGGFAHIAMPGKTVFVLGVSGGGKTFLAEQFGATFARDGEDGVWWGPEWTAEEMQLRAIQRAGGVTMERFNQDRLWRIDEANGAPPHLNRGVKLGEAARDQTLQIIKRMKDWPGQMHYIQENEYTPVQLLEAIKMKVASLRANGRRVRTLWIDYLQLWYNSGGKDDAMGPEMALKQIKRITEQLGLLCFVILQPRKGDSEEARDGEILHHASAQGISDQKCQLMLTLTPIFDDAGKKQDEAWIDVVKNSMGRTGRIRVPVNWARLYWQDERESTAPKVTDE